MRPKRFGRTIDKRMKFAKQNPLQSRLGRSESVAARNRRPGRRPGAEERIGPDSWSCYPPWSFLAGRPCRLQRGIAALCALKPRLSGHLRLAYLQNGTRRTRAGSDGGSLPKNGTSRASRGGARRSISPRRRGARRSSATRRDSANPAIDTQSGALVRSRKLLSKETNLYCNNLYCTSRHQYYYGSI